MPSESLDESESRSESSSYDAAEAGPSGEQPQQSDITTCFSNHHDSGNVDHMCDKAGDAEEDGREEESGDEGGDGSEEGGYDSGDGEQGEDVESIPNSYLDDPHATDFDDFNNDYGDKIDEDIINQIYDILGPETEAQLHDMSLFVLSYIRCFA